MSGVSPKNPSDYTGPKVALVPTVSRNRRPLTTDYRQPETGKLYPITSVWQVSKDPTTGVEGELWMLSKIVANVATWVMVSGGGAGPVVTFDTDDGNTVTPDGLGNIDLNGVIVANATNAKPLFTDGATANTVLYELQVAAARTGAPANTNDAGIASFDDTHFSVDANGYVSLIGGGQAIDTLTGNTGGEVSPDIIGNIDFVGVGETTVTGTPASNLLEIFSPRTAEFVVDPVVNNGTHTTIQAAVTAASAQDTIFIRPGTYTEDITLKAGLTIIGTKSVIIRGKITANYTGTSTLQNMSLRTNGDYAIDHTGTSDNVLRIFNCFFSITDNTFLRCNNASASSALEIFECQGEFTPGFTLFEHSGRRLRIINSQIGIGAQRSSVASTFSSNTGIEDSLEIRNSRITVPITTSNIGVFNFYNTEFMTNLLNSTCLTANNSGASRSSHCQYNSGTATAIVVSNNLRSNQDIVISSNAAAISGAGTLTYGDLLFAGTSSTITTTTKVPISARTQAWATFNGTGTPAFHDSFNFTSITDVGTGSWTLNFTTNLSNANYNYQVSSVEPPIGNAFVAVYSPSRTVSGISILSIQLNSSAVLTSAVDVNDISVTCIGQR